MKKLLLLTTILSLTFTTTVTFSQNKISDNWGKGNDSCLKVNYPLPGTMKLLTYSSPTDGKFYGYVSGNSINGDKIKANIFTYNASYPYISGVSMKFGFAYNTTNPDIKIALWNFAVSKPGLMLTYKTIPMSKIIDDIKNDKETFIQFDSSVKVTGNYFIGVILPQDAGDTVALMSNTNGDTKPGIAWEQWADDNWHAYSEYTCWYINIANAIYPMACNYQIHSGIDDNKAFNLNINVFPNPAKDHININLNTSDYKELKINVYNLLGNCLKTIKIKNSYKNNYQIDMQDIPQGLYYLSVEADKYKVTRKFTIIK